MCTLLTELPNRQRSLLRKRGKTALALLLRQQVWQAHLAGAIAANTTLPVIGIPCGSQNLGGIDALLSTVQMPSGIPVATVAVNGGANAALLSAQILALEDGGLAEKLDTKRKLDSENVLKNDAEIFSQFAADI